MCLCVPASSHYKISSSKPSGVKKLASLYTGEGQGFLNSSFTIHVAQEILRNASLIGI